jgi:hypothetical protein
LGRTGPETLAAILRERAGGSGALGLVRVLVEGETAEAIAYAASRSAGSISDAWLPGDAGFVAASPLTWVEGGYRDSTAR